MEYVGIVIGIVGLAVGLWVRALLAGRRGRQLKAAAEHLGFSYSPADDGTVLDRLKGFALFERGFDRSISHVVSTESTDLSITAFDYRYTTDKTGPIQNPMRCWRLAKMALLLEPKTATLPVLGIDSDANSELNPEYATYRREHPAVDVESNGKVLLVHQGMVHPDWLETLIDEAKGLLALLRKDSQGGRRPQPKNPAAGRKSQVEGECTYEDKFL